MKVYLAAMMCRPAEFTIKWSIPFMLESYFYIKPWQIDYMNSPLCRSFMLDSGAFTFMNKTKAVSLKEYAYQYAEFINKHEIELFFELDVDAVEPLKSVEEYRAIIERETGKKSIPVWHKGRGLQYFRDMVQEYDYVAIGGLVTGEIKPSEYKYFHTLISEAHQAGALIHGLGFTRLSELQKYEWDSVDSRSWQGGSLSGSVYHFDGKDLKSLKAPNRRRKGYLLLDNHNLHEWVKYANYMDRRPVLESI